MTEQANEWGEDFCSFFIHKRLAPQLRIAGQKGKGGGKELEGVFGGRNVERLLFKVREGGRNEGRKGGREGRREGWRAEGKVNKMQA